MRRAMLFVFLFLWFIVPGVHGQDSDDVSVLKARIAELESKLEAAEKKIQELQEDNDSLKDAKSPGDKARKSLLESIPAGTVLEGKYELVTGTKADQHGGACTLTILEVKGNKFRATYLRPEDTRLNVPTVEMETEGTISNNAIMFRAVGETTKSQFKGTRRGTYLDLVWTAQNGAQAKVQFRLPE